MIKYNGEILKLPLSGKENTFTFYFPSDKKQKCSVEETTVLKKQICINLHMSL